MTLDILFLLSCPICTWWLLPLLLIAWLLGWLFWSLFFKKKYVNRIKYLEGEVVRLSGLAGNLERDLVNTRSENERALAQYSVAQDDIANLEMRLKDCEEGVTNNNLMPPVIDEEPTEVEYIIEEPEVEESPLEINKLSQPEPTMVPPPPPPPPMPEPEPEPEIVLEPEPKPELKITGMGGVFESDDLQIIEGIGPKIEGLLKAARLHTWTDVAAASVEDLQQILDNAGPRYRVHKPNSWPEQARLAANAHWSDLVKYQKFLDTGKDMTTTTSTSPSKVEKLYAKKIGFAAFKVNDLKLVEGIGPKIEGLLQAAGIDTWEKLANTTEFQLQAILDAAGDRYRLADPTTWSKQAGLASESKWRELKAYQNKLRGK